MAPRKIPLAERFAKWTRQTESGCWEWLGQIGSPATGGRYGYMKHEGKKQKAANIAYVWKKGPIPRGLQVSHLCGNHLCVNPDHLIAETGKENWHRSDAPKRFGRNGIVGRQKFVCDKCGAAYEVIGVRKSGRQAGQPEYGCRFCRAERARQWREENPDAYRAWFTENKDHVNQTRRVRRRKHGSF